MLAYIAGPNVLVLGSGACARMVPELTMILKVVKCPVTAIKPFKAMMMEIRNRTRWVLFFN